MNAERIVRRTRYHPEKDKTDWKRLAALTDREIEEAIASDPDAAPLLDEEWFRTAKLVMPERKVPVSMRIDRDVLDWFKQEGRGYLSRMHAVLRAYVSANSRAQTKSRKTSAAHKNRSQRKKGDAKTKTAGRVRGKNVGGRTK